MKVPGTGWLCKPFELYRIVGYERRMVVHGEFGVTVTTRSDLVALHDDRFYQVVRLLANLLGPREQAHMRKLQTHNLHVLISARGGGPAPETHWISGGLPGDTSPAGVAEEGDQQDRPQRFAGHGPGRWGEALQAGACEDPGCPGMSGGASSRANALPPWRRPPSCPPPPAASTHSRGTARRCAAAAISRIVLSPRSACPEPVHDVDRGSYIGQ